MKKYIYPRFGSKKINLNIKNNTVGEEISIPDNLKAFLFNYNHSKFIECYEKTPYFNKKLVEKNPKQNQTKNKIIKPYLKYFKNYFESQQKNFWIISGSLLGNVLKLYNLFFK